MAHASLFGANLTGCNLEGTDLQHADLTLANLNGSRVSGANFARALLSKTEFSRVPDLARAIGLNELTYADRSSIDLWTLQTAAGGLPEALLVHIGMTPAFRANLDGVDARSYDAGC